MALTFRQDDVVALRHRGIAEYYSGRSEQALRDLDQAVKRTPVDPYAALWDHIVALRRGETDRRPELQQAIQLGRWPTPVLRFYSDQIDAETLSLSAIALSPETARDQRCEVDFYRGERALLTNDPTAARPLIMAAASECPHSFIEFDAARQELAGHGALPPQ
jgi:lipoprotein NlpI